MGDKLRVEIEFFKEEFDELRGEVEFFKEELKDKQEEFESELSDKQEELNDVAGWAENVVSYLLGIKDECIESSHHATKLLEDCPVTFSFHVETYEGDIV